MRLAFISTILGYPWGGADTLWTHAAEAAAYRGDSLLLCVSPAVAVAPRIVALSERGARIHTRTAPAGPARLAARLSQRLRRAVGMRDPLVAVLAAFQPDLVIISLGGTYDLLSYPALVTWLHSSRTPYCTIANWQEENPILPEADRERAREAFALARTVAFVSTRNLSATRRHLLHPLSNARVLQNPLRWTSADVAPWPVAPDWRLATVSRLDLGKGIQLLLHALAQELAGERDWRLNIYGQGPAADYLHTTVAYLRLGDRVQFRGHVGNLHTIWAENHLLCSPALNDGVPMTIPEAMLCGRPALATCVGGAEDWIRPGANGFLCPAPTLPLLADALRTAWEERDRWRELGQQAAIDARARYKPDDYLQVIAP